MVAVCGRHASQAFCGFRAPVVRNSSFFTLLISLWCGRISRLIKSKLNIIRPLKFFSRLFVVVVVLKQHLVGRFQ